MFFIHKNYVSHMNVSKVNLVYFSPTRTSRLISSAVAKGTGLSVNHVDLTLSGSEIVDFSADELVIFAAPVYSGRIPETAVDRFKQIKGSGTPSVIIATYGNRAYEDALLELKNIVQDQNFLPIGAGAFIGEHSFHSEELPIAKDRPDGNDIQTAMNFGKRVREKLSNPLDSIDLNVPGEMPYRVRRRREENVSPETLDNLCILCGLCADVCPTSAITLGKSVSTSQALCIRCCACIKECPTGARVPTSNITKIAKWLHDEYSERKEPEIFI